MTPFLTFIMPFILYIDSLYISYQRPVTALERLEKEILYQRNESIPYANSLVAYLLSSAYIKAIGIFKRLLFILNLFNLRQHNAILIFFILRTHLGLVLDFLRKLVYISNIFTRPCNCSSNGFSCQEDKKSTIQVQQQTN